MEMSSVFLSYSRKDGSYANQLQAVLDRLEVHGFLDETDIATGGVWDKQIRDTIRNADAVVIVLSEHSVHSNWVMAEAGMAWGLDKRIIPVIPPGSKLDMSEIPPILQDAQILDARELSPTETAEQILDAISHSNI